MTSQQRERVVHQDYLARIRYTNVLPPPPNPPKLLDIPGTGLAGGQYTSSGYAAKLAHEQPLNIEADAELGMAINLIGIPGVFDGDESAIMARQDSAPLHPADKALLKPLSTIGKTAVTAGAVSFLRRSEHTAAGGVQIFLGGTSKNLLRHNDDDRKRKDQAKSKEDPLNIIRNIVKGFNIAYPKDEYKGEENTTSIRGAPASHAEHADWNKPQHPTKKMLTLVDSYPVLPDLDALPSSGCYQMIKLASNPAAGSGAYDERLDVAMLRVREDASVMAKWQQKRDEWDPATSTKPEPLPELDYDYYLPAEGSGVAGIKRKFDTHDTEAAQDDDLYTHDTGEGARAFKFTRLRTYETQNQTGNPNNLYDDTIALALHDPEALALSSRSSEPSRLPKGAFMYPLLSRTVLRPKRKLGATALHVQQDDERVDEINLVATEIDDHTRQAVAKRQNDLDPTVIVPEMESQEVEATG